MNYHVFVGATGNASNGKIGQFPQDLHVNYRFMLSWMHEQSITAGSSARFLDYGCGNGKVVVAARDSGLECVGAETFYEGHSKVQIEDLKKAGLLGGVVYKIDGGRLPFPDEFFDGVVSNQVFEHVVNLNAVLLEIHRVLKPNGRLLSLFADSGVVREGHVGVPMAHWFKKGSRLREHYMTVARTLGHGTKLNPGEKPREWARRYGYFLDNLTVYRSYHAIRKAYDPLFMTNHVEEEYIRLRLPKASYVLRIPGMTSLARFAFTKVAGIIMDSKKRNMKY